MNGAQVAAVRARFASIPTDMLARVPKPDGPVSPDPSQLDAFAPGDPEELVFRAVRLLERIVRMARSLSRENRLTVLADIWAIEQLRLDPMQHSIEQLRSFLSDQSAKAARKRRRRQKRVRATLEVEAPAKFEPPESIPNLREMFVGGRGVPGKRERSTDGAR